MSTLSGPYRIDRVEVPEFFVPKDPDNSHRFSTDTVLTVTDDHPSRGWVTLGVVSVQSPLGQGYYCGFATKELELAPVELVLHALMRDHPSMMGKLFVPTCQELLDLSFHSAMGSVVGNWLNDGVSERPPVTRLTTRGINAQRAKLIAQYEQIIANWARITYQQRRHIFAALCPAYASQ